jgi:hypothetical protein|tara:strand:+ start:140 stop:466 length:327 start_codon:yes stop_codon:yes gene_type:complete
LTKIRCISTPDDCDRIFDLLSKIKPHDISFSRVIAMAAQEYIDNHKKDNTKISDFVSKDMSNSLPAFFGDIEVWKKIVEKMPPSELKKIQVRHRQIDTIIRKRVESFL